MAYPDYIHESLLLGYLFNSAFEDEVLKEGAKCSNAADSPLLFSCTLV